MSISKLQEKPGHLIRRCQQIAVALFLDYCEPFDLTPMQYAILHAVAAEPGLDQISIAGLVALDRSNAARVCAALETRGLLERALDTKDRRVRRLSISAAGKKLLDRAEPAVLQVQKALLTPLSPSQRREFIAALNIIAAAHNETSRAPQRDTTGDITLNPAP